MASGSSRAGLLDRVLPSAARACVLNISSMRSVTRKPPTTLIVPKTIAITRITLLKRCRCRRGRARAGRRARRSRGSRWCPTSAACAACSGTFEITSKPTKPASTRIASLVTESHRLSPHVGGCAGRGLGALVDDLAVARDARAGDDLVVEVERRARRPRRSSARAAPARCARTAARRARPSCAGRFSGETIVTSWRTTVSPGSVSSQLPPPRRRGRRSRAGLHALDGLGGDELRRRAARARARW